MPCEICGSEDIESSVVPNPEYTGSGCFNNPTEYRRTNSLAKLSPVKELIDGEDLVLCKNCKRRINGFYN